MHHNLCKFTCSTSIKLCSPQLCGDNNINKKVLLRERKRHTAHRVASTRCAALSNPDLVGGYPIPGPGGVCHPCLGGTLSQVWGVPHPRSRGYPVPGLGGTPSRPGQGVPWVPPYLDLGWGTPHLDLGWGTPPTWTWDGVLPLPRPEMGSPPPQQVWTD